jgi:DNA primase
VIDFNDAAPQRQQLEPIADLKARLDIADIVGRHVRLKPSRGGLVACCPFHHEKTPSFKVDRETQRFICFGCGAKGDVIDFLAAIENLDRVASLKRARELAGGSFVARPVPRRPPEPDKPDAEAERKREQAQEVWRTAEDIQPGSDGFRYLVERRGIRHWDPERLRWHPEGTVKLMGPVEAR